MTLVATSLRSCDQPTLTSLGLDLTAIEQVLSPDIAGLSSSVKGAFGTLNCLLEFPLDDLRRAPDAVLLLAPNAALFLCLLLCLPCNGILGPSFQRTAVGLIRDTAKHVGESVKSPQDTVALTAAYLDSLVDLLHQPATEASTTTQEMIMPLSFDLPDFSIPTGGLGVDDTTLQAAQVLAGGMGGFNSNLGEDDAMHIQSLSNLLDGSFFWEMMPPASETNTGPQ
jgi:hypothetical protein